MARKKLSDADMEGLTFEDEAPNPAPVANPKPTPVGKPRFDRAALGGLGQIVQDVMPASVPGLRDSLGREIKASAVTVPVPSGAVIDPTMLPGGGLTGERTPTRATFKEFPDIQMTAEQLDSPLIDPTRDNAALAGGALAGGSMNFADETAGAQSLAETILRERSLKNAGSAFRTGRDRMRADIADVEKYNPTKFAVGNIGASIPTALIPGMSAARGASFGQQVLRSGLVPGLVSGFGASTGDLTKGEFAKVGIDTAAAGLAGAGTTAALGGLGRAVKNIVPRAEARSAQKVLDAATHGKSKKTVAQLDAGEVDAVSDGGKELVVDAVKKEGMERDLLKPIVKFNEAVQEKRDVVGQRIGDMIMKANEETVGIKVPGIVSRLKKLRSNSGKDTERYKAITAEIERIEATYSPEKGVGEAYYPLWEAWDKAKELGRMGYNGVGQAYTDPTESKKLGRELARAYREAVYAETSRVMRGRPAIGTKVDLDQARASYNRLSALAVSTEEAAEKARAARPDLRERLLQLGQLGGVATGVGVANAGAPRLGAAIAAAPFAIGAGRMADNALARMILAAKAGADNKALRAIGEKAGIVGKKLDILLSAIAPGGAGQTVRRAASMLDPREAALVAAPRAAAGFSAGAARDVIGEATADNP